MIRKLNLSLVFQVRVVNQQETIGSYLNGPVKDASSQWSRVDVDSNKVNNDEK